MKDCIWEVKDFTQKMIVVYDINSDNEEELVALLRKMELMVEIY